jgi:hypothetical protein
LIQVHVVARLDKSDLLEDPVPAVTSWTTTRFAIKHVIAAALVAAGMAVCAAVSFVVGIMMMAARGTSAAGFPSTVLLTFLAGIASVVLVLAPVTMAAERLTRRARLHVRWQIPIALALLGVVGLGLTWISGVSGVAPEAAARSSSIVTAALLIPLAAYWLVLQSADWLLRRAGHKASRLWPARFAALSEQRELTISGRPIRVAGRIHIRDHVTFVAGQNPVIVIVGDAVEGVVRGGMRVFAVRGTTALSATITSVERIDESASAVRLIVCPNEQDLALWKSAALEGQVLQIA